MRDSSVKKKKGGVFLAFALIVAGTVLLFNNEKNVVKNNKTVDEIKKNAVEILDGKINSNNEGKLVSVSGDITSSSDELVDVIFNVKSNTVKLKRKVEVYQWIEDNEDGSDKKKYDKEWSEELIDSSEFEVSGHSNPTTKNCDSEIITSDEIKVGEYSLSNSLKKLLSTNKRLDITNMNEIYLPSNYNIIDNYITNSSDYNNPKIGDIRVSYEYNDWKSATVLAKQEGSSFTTYVSKVGQNVNKVYNGKLTVNQVVDKIVHSNKLSKWFFRGVGILIIVLGFSSIFSFLTSILDKVPLVGQLASGVIKFVTGLIGLVFALLIIVIAWFRYRPVISLCLIGVITIIVAIIIVKTRQGKVEVIEENKNDK